MLSSKSGQQGQQDRGSRDRGAAGAAGTDETGPSVEASGRDEIGLTVSTIFAPKSPPQPELRKINLPAASQIEFPLLGYLAAAMARIKNGHAPTAGRENG
jgi:hypothetical protein